MSEKHTPGPWMVHPRFPEHVVVASDPPKKIGGADDPDVEAEGWAKQICTPDLCSDYPEFHRSRVTSRAEQYANAHLIAAAPDYHEASLAMIARHDAEAKAANFDKCGCENCKPFRAIAAKAEGRS